MSQKNRKIVVFTLFVIFTIWLLINVTGVFTKTLSPNEQKRSNTGQNYEPKFRKDGELWIVKANAQDTLAYLDIEIVQSDEAIQYGMMYRKSMELNRGMLFIMQMERPQSFWMKNTYIPLDIIYINSNNTIVSIQENAQPLSEKSLPSYEPAIYILEVNGGYCAQMGIQAGDQVLFKKNQDI